MKLRTLIAATTLVFSFNASAAGQDIQQQFEAYANCLQKNDLANRMAQLTKSKKYQAEQTQIEKYCAQNQPVKATKISKELWHKLQKEQAYIEMNKCLALAPFIKEKQEAAYKEMIEGDICKTKKEAEELGKALEKMNKQK